MEDTGTVSVFLFTIFFCTIVIVLLYVKVVRHPYPPLHRRRLASFKKKVKSILDGRGSYPVEDVYVTSVKKVKSKHGREEQEPERNLIQNKTFGEVKSATLTTSTSASSGYVTPLGPSRTDQATSCINALMVSRGQGTESVKETLQEAQRLEKNEQSNLVPSEITKNKLQEPNQETKPPLKSSSDRGTKQCRKTKSTLAPIVELSAERVLSAHEKLKPVKGSEKDWKSTFLDNQGCEEEIDDSKLEGNEEVHLARPAMSTMITPNGIHLDVFDDIDVCSLTMSPLETVIESSKKKAKRSTSQTKMKTKRKVAKKETQRRTKKKPVARHDKVHFEANDRSSPDLSVSSGSIDLANPSDCGAGDVEPWFGKKVQGIIPSHKLPESDDGPSLVPVRSNDSKVGKLRLDLLADEPLSVATACKAVIAERISEVSHNMSESRATTQAHVKMFSASEESQGMTSSWGFTSSRK